MIFTLFSCADLKRVNMEVVNYYFNSKSGTVHYKYEIDGETYKLMQHIGVDIKPDLIFVPIGGRYKMTYNTNRPKGTFSHLILLYHPIYDSTQVFERTTCHVTKEYFRYRRDNLIYGGLQLIFKYEVDGKEYVSHNGIKLDEVFPDVENPKEELSFVGKKFVVEYDVDNPYIARILLDEEVK